MLIVTNLAGLHSAGATPADLAGLQQLAAEAEAAAVEAMHQQSASEHACRNRVDELETALAETVRRAEAAEAKLDAVPVGAIRRYFDQSDAYEAVRAGEYDMHVGMADAAEIAEWLAGQEVQP